MKLAEALCSLLIAAPDSPLASHGLQQVTVCGDTIHLYFCQSGPNSSLSDARAVKFSCVDASNLQQV